MFRIFTRPIADWLAFHGTYAAFRRLDPHLRADLGLADADLRRLSRRAMHWDGPVSLFTLLADDDGRQGISSIVWQETGSASDSPSASMASVKNASLPRLHHSYCPET